MGNYFSAEERLKRIGSRIATAVSETVYWKSAQIFARQDLHDPLSGARKTITRFTVVAGEFCLKAYATTPGADATVSFQKCLNNALIKVRDRQAYHIRMTKAFELAEEVILNSLG